MGFEDESLYAVIAIPVIFLLGFAGAVTPSVLARFFPRYGLTKKIYFSFFNGMAAGIILAVAVIHSLVDAAEGFETALTGDSQVDGYPWAYLIAMVAILFLFSVEELLDTLARHFRLGSGLHGHGQGGDDGDGDNENDSDDERQKVAETKCGHTPAEHEATAEDCEGKPLDVEQRYSSDEEEKQQQKGQESENEKRKAEEDYSKESSSSLLLKMLILFTGLLLHNIFVGLAMGLARNDLALFIALLFHQFFEGLGMGSRVVMAKLRSILLVLTIDVVFAAIPVVFIGIGIGLQHAVDDTEDTDGYSITSGVLQGLSAGVLLYVAVVHMMRAYQDCIPLHRNKKGENQQHWVDSIDWHRLASFLGLLFGSAVMAVIGIWG